MLKAHWKTFEINQYKAFVREGLVKADQYDVWLSPEMNRDFRRGKSEVILIPTAFDDSEILQDDLFFPFSFNADTPDKTMVGEPLHQTAKPELIKSSTLHLQHEQLAENVWKTQLEGIQQLPKTTDIYRHILTR